MNKQELEERVFDIETKVDGLVEKIGYIDVSLMAIDTKLGILLSDNGSQIDVINDLSKSIEDVKAIVLNLQLSS